MNDLLYRRFFSDLPELYTARLCLRRMQSTDDRDVHEYASREEVPRYLLWTPHLNLRETQGYLEFMQKRYRKGIHAEWGVTLAATGKLIGTCGVTAVDLPNESCELGYVLSPDFWGYGYMDEAFEAVLHAVFDRLQAHRVTLRILEGNTHSMLFAERHGFRLEGSEVEALYVKGAYRTVLHYAMLHREYEDRKQKRTV